MRWDDDHQFLSLHGQLPALQGAIVEDTFKAIVEAMRPASGQPWARWDQRAADALTQLCEQHGSVAGSFDPTGLARRPLFVAEIPLHGPATIAGAPVPDTLLEAWRAEARIEPVVVDDHNEPLTTGRITSTLSKKQRRAVLVRDGHCRWEHCDRTHGLHNHHLWPRSWGGTDELSNRAAICSGGATDHHLKVVPHGPWLLLGNPNQPDGLHLVHRDDIPDLDQYIHQRRPPTPQELEQILGHTRHSRRDRAGPHDP
jgi:hypothetical protein